MQYLTDLEFFPSTYEDQFAIAYRKYEFKLLLLAKKPDLTQSWYEQLQNCKNIQRKNLNSSFLNMTVNHTLMGFQKVLAVALLRIRNLRMTFLFARLRLKRFAYV